MQYFLDCIFRFEIFCYQIVITHEITIFDKPESFLRIAFLSYCQLDKLELNKIAARWPAKAVAQFFYSF